MFLSHFPTLAITRTGARRYRQQNPDVDPFENDFLDSARNTVDLKERTSPTRKAMMQLHTYYIDSIERYCSCRGFTIAHISAHRKLTWQQKFER
jgi:hypothetical protein